MNKIAAFVIIIFLIAFGNSVFAQTGSISGKIISEEGNVASASIALKKTKKATIADASGSFSIKNMMPGAYILRVSCIGYDDYEQAVIVQNNETVTMTIRLLPDKTMLNTVVVTGVSKATLIRENPVAIVGVSTKQLEKSNESNLVDALAKNVPGLHAVKTGPNISKPFIRGLGYNRVLTLYDGLRQEGQQWGDEHGIEADAYQITRAEVIKGPASLQYGSDAVAGVVSLFPYVPANTNGKITGGSVSEYQTNNNLTGNGLHAGFASKHFLFAASGSLRLAKNYRNAIDGSVYNTGFTEKNVSVLAGFTNNNGYSHLNITLYDNLQGIPDGSRDSLTRKFTKQANEGNNDDIKNRPLVSGDELNAYHLSPLHQHIQHYRIYTHHYYRSGSGDIDALLGFQQNIRREYNHPSAPQQAGLYVRLNTINYSLRYTAPQLAGIELTTGVNGMAQNNKSLTATDFPIPDYRLFDFGTYVYGKWKYNQWTISGGVRYDVRYISWDDFYTKTNAATGFSNHVAATDTASGYLQFHAFQKTSGGLSASIGFTFRVNPHISLKANASKGYRAPGITELASNGLDPGAHIIYLGDKNFVPEFSLQQDIGISIIYNNINADISLFNNNIRHYIYLTLLTDATGNAIADAQGNKTFQYQQAAAQLYGMEAWFSYHAQKIKGFSFDNSLAMVYGFNRKVQYKNKAINGEYLPLIPPLKIVSSITQKTTFKSGWLASLSPKIEMEYNAAQSRFLGLNNTETATPAYTLANAGIVSEIKYAKLQTLQLQLQVNNIFDKSYQSHLSRLTYFEYYAQSPNAHTGIYNMGRNICLKMILPF